MPAKLTVEDKAIRDAMKQTEKNARQPRPLLIRIHAHQQKESGLMFRFLAKGGTRRTVSWGWFADQYTRKTDGVTVPAEGGVKRLRGERYQRGNKKTGVVRGDF